jgi:hypothetical protein
LIRFAFERSARFAMRVRPPLFSTIHARAAAACP